MLSRSIAFSVWLGLFTSTGFAAMPQWEPAGALLDPSFAAGLEALRREDWEDMVVHMMATIQHRPWDDDAFTLLGFAYRKRSDYSRALEAYQRALSLNPYHRGALEYLGETYVELNRLPEARAVRERLEYVCRQSVEGDWRADCQEWVELDELIESVDAQD